jgi:hypothetical protein
MSVAMPPLPNTPSWRGAQLKRAQGQLYPTFVDISCSAVEFNAVVARE